jgi:hypothetical protein
VKKHIKLFGSGICSQRKDARVLWVAASLVAEKLLSFVGRAFRHDMSRAFSSGVLTPEGAKLQFSASCYRAI